MKKVYVIPIDKLLVLEENISTLFIESPSLFRKISCELDENIIYSINNEAVELNKNALIIYNPFELNVNDSKFLKLLYKRIEKQLKLQEYLEPLQEKLINTINEVSIDLEYEVEYDNSTDVSKILSSIGLKYKEPESYLERLVLYINVITEISTTNLIISFGLLSLLEKEEQLLLKKELMYKDIHLLDINFKNKLTKDIIIDKDWCII